MTSSRNYPNWLKAYLEYTFNSESPDIFHFWTGVSTIAGTLRRRVWIDQRHFQWTPNFYIILVGPAGIAAKSTTMRLGAALLKEVPGIHLGPQSMTWQSLTHSLAEARDLVPFESAPGEEPTYLTMSCITCAVGELGTFFRPDNKDLTDVLVSLWDGQLESWRRDTKTQGSDDILNPWINIIACVTPSWLRDNFPESMIGGGFTSRIVFVYGDDKRKFVAYPSEQIDQAEYENRAKLLVEDLKLIAEIKGEYKLEPDAIKWGTAWYEQHWGSRPIHMASDRFGGYMARKQTHIHKLAIVIAASQRDKLIITKDDLETSANFVTGLEGDMIKVFESIGVSDNSRYMGEILAYVRAYKKISKMELWRSCMNIMSPRDFQEATDAAVTAGYLKLEMDPRKGTVYVATTVH